jgi:hypothetical protein
MQKNANGKFTRFYVSAFFRCTSAEKDVDLFLFDRQWIDNFSGATLFDENELQFVEQWLSEKNNRPERMNVVVRKVDCQVNGFDMGRFL